MLVRNKVRMERRTHDASRRSHREKRNQHHRGSCNVRDDRMETGGKGQKGQYAKRHQRARRSATGMTAICHKALRLWPELRNRPALARRSPQGNRQHGSPRPAKRQVPWHARVRSRVSGSIGTLRWSYAWTAARSGRNGIGVTFYRMGRDSEFEPQLALTGLVQVRSEVTLIDSH